MNSRYVLALDPSGAYKEGKGTTGWCLFDNETKQIAKVADYVVLVGEKRTKPIYEGILSEGFDKDNIIVYNDVREAYKFIETQVGNEEVYALFENDLPDSYNE